jgi:hypothetical protein
MLLVMWTVAPNGWFRGVSRPTDQTPGTAQNPDRSAGSIHAEPDDYGTCSLLRHTIRERID